MEASLVWPFFASQEGVEQEKDSAAGSADSQCAQEAKNSAAASEPVAATPKPPPPTARTAAGPCLQPLVLPSEATAAAAPEAEALALLGVKCRVCNRWLNGQIQFDEHLQCKRHFKALRKAARAERSAGGGHIGHARAEEGEGVL